MGTEIPVRVLKFLCTPSAQSDLVSHLERAYRSAILRTTRQLIEGLSGVNICVAGVPVSKADFIFIQGHPAAPGASAARTSRPSSSAS